MGGCECKVRLCDMESGSSTHILRSHSKPVLSLAWSPYSDHLLASGDEGGVVLLWDVRKASGPMRSLDQHNGRGASNIPGTVVDVGVVLVPVLSSISGNSNDM